MFVEEKDYLNRVSGMRNFSFPSFDKNFSILPPNFSALNFGLEFVAKRSLSLFSILIKAASLKSKGHKGRSVIG